MLAGRPLPWRQINGPAARKRPGPWHQEAKLRMQVDPKPPRRLRVERSIYRNPSADGLEIPKDGGVPVRQEPAVAKARLARAEAGVQDRRAPVQARRSFGEVGEEWLALQTHLRPRSRALYQTALRRHLAP